MELKEAYQLFNQVRRTIKKFEDGRGSFPDDFEFNYDDTNERFMHEVARSIMDKLFVIKQELDWINYPIRAEGPLVKRNDGRYEIEGTNIYFTSGSPLDVWDSESENWYRSVVEHNGTDYYIKVFGKKRTIKGVIVRARA